MFKTVTISIRLLKSGSPLFKFVVKVLEVSLRVEVRDNVGTKERPLLPILSR